MNQEQPQDTICAIATAQGGAIGLIRVSGPEAIGITDCIFTPAGEPVKPLTARPAYTLNAFPGTAFIHGRGCHGNFLPRFTLHPRTGNAAAH